MIPTVRDKQECAQSCPYTRPLGTCRVRLSPLSASPGSEHGSPGKPRTCLSSARPAGGSLSLRREPRKSCEAGRQVSRAPPGAVLPAPEPQPREPGGGGQRPPPRAGSVGGPCRGPSAQRPRPPPRHSERKRRGRAEMGVPGVGLPQWPCPFLSPPSGAQLRGLSWAWVCPCDPHAPAAQGTQGGEGAWLPV